MFLSAFTLMISCGDSEKKEKDDVTIGDYSTPAPKKETQATNSKDMVDFSNKGIGPVKSINITDDIDQALAVKGKTVFDNMCTACHKLDKKYIGPALADVTERRSAEWIMNMILNPEEMIAKDPIAKQLLVESNMAVMANQNLKEDEARAILESFRSLPNE
ncbi:hypothetical protein BH23BAC2_BH23BAC2_27370 [soil metagenome]